MGNWWNLGACLLSHDANIRGRVKQACVDFERDLRAFLAGVLRDPHLAEEAFQKTVVKAIEAGSPPGPEKIRGWLFQVSLNVARDLKREQARERKHRQTIQETAAAWSPPDSNDGISQLIQDEEKELVQQALGRLKSDHREVVLRRIQRGQTFAEIAADLDRPLGTVLTWMRRALSELQDMDIFRQFSNDDSSAPPKDPRTDH